MTTMYRTAQLTARWAARGISMLAAAFWLLILLDILVCDALVGFICVNWEMVLLAGLVIASVLSVIIAWQRESIGGFVMFFLGSRLHYICLCNRWHLSGLFDAGVRCALFDRWLIVPSKLVVAQICCETLKF